MGAWKPAMRPFLSSYLLSITDPDCNNPDHRHELRKKLLRSLRKLRKSVANQ